MRGLFDSRRKSLAAGAQAAMLMAIVSFASAAATAQDADPVVALDGRAGGILGNDRIEASWSLRDGHLGALTIHNKAGLADAAGGTIALPVPFSIELTQIGVLHAGDFQVDGDARVEHLTPNAAAARASERLSGIAVHYALSDPKGRFKADWALTMRQGSAYVRQVLTLTAGTAPLPLSGVGMVDARVPGIAVAGTVKGSPLTAGNFFMGFESPLSQSSVVGDHGVSELESGVPIAAQQTAQYSAVVGVAAEGQIAATFSPTLNESAPIRIELFCTTTAGSTSDSSARTRSRMR